MQTYIFSKMYKFLHNFILAPTKTLANEFSMFLMNFSSHIFPLTLYPKLFLQNFSYFFQEYFYWKFLSNFFLQFCLTFFPRICFPLIFYQPFLLNIFQRFFSRKCSANNFWEKKFCETYYVTSMGERGLQNDDIWWQGGGGLRNNDIINKGSFL